MKAILVAAVMAAGIGHAQACGTGGSQARLDGVEDCGTSYQKSLEGYHQQDMRALDRKLEYERARAKANAEIRALQQGSNSPPPSNMQPAPNPPQRPSVAGNPAGTGNATSEACRAYPAMCSAYK